MISVGFPFASTAAFHATDCLDGLSKELADGSLTTSFTVSCLSSLGRANNLFSSHVRNSIIYKNTLLKRSVFDSNVRSSRLFCAMDQSQSYNQKEGSENDSKVNKKENTSSETDSRKTNNAKSDKNISSEGRTVLPAFHQKNSGSKLRKSTLESLKALFWRVQSDYPDDKNVGRKNMNNDYSKSPGRQTEDPANLSATKDPVNPARTQDALLNAFQKFRHNSKRAIRDEAAHRKQSTYEKFQSPRSRSYNEKWINYKSQSAAEFFKNSLGQKKTLSGPPSKFVHKLPRPPSKFARKSPIPLSAIRSDVRPVPGLQKLEHPELHEASSGNGSFPRPSESSQILLDDLDKYNLSELKNFAKSYGLKGYSKLKKSELLEHIKNKARQS
eukprot:TRINITY_DN3871_c0_g1_i1.p1 TRINITY_DN3871_c0_g1~~TRINITY_DN3871_c0_g1_i1.p1  ORF type:complete len:385 (-),score=78.50 TRINITY_DN3871_c0_g1_i1:350-1504(-)